MFLGFDDSLKNLKKELKDAGADIGIVRDWQKYYDKVRKQTPQLEAQYQQAKADLEKVYALLLGMEQKLIAVKEASETELASKIRSEIGDFAKEMKRYQGSFHHEFLISSQDSEFHLTYATLLNLCDKPLQNLQEVLIVQSEVENLLALAKEAMEKPWPAFRAMAFYYVERSDKEIYDLPHADKVAKVCRVYENEFLKPIQDCMKGHLSAERIKQIMEEELWKY